jgi:hypothetical protein
LAYYRKAARSELTERLNTEGHIMENIIDEAVALIAQARAIRSGMVAAGADVARIDEAIAHATGDVEYTRRRRMGYAA